MMILFVLIIGFAFYYLYNNSSSKTFKLSKSPEDLLKERFVNGEIDEKTYIEMKETLKG